MSATDDLVEMLSKHPDWHEIDSDDYSERDAGWAQYESVVVIETNDFTREGVQIVRYFAVDALDLDEEG